MYKEKITPNEFIHLLEKGKHIHTYRLYSVGSPQVALCRL